MGIIIVSGIFDPLHSGHIIEIQYSPERKEDDIDRHSYYLKNEDY
tara:strand:+ start:396 stop:530 length:135 start_codon:yes stop_codon:yes gene_type:complete